MALEGSYGDAEDLAFENENNSEDRINMMVNRLILQKLPFEMDERVESMINMNPIGLRLHTTPELVNSVEMAMKGRSRMEPDKEKLKASNIPASFLKIGNYQVVSENEGDLVGKCYFAKRKVVWEVLDTQHKLKRKIEIQWSHISALKATFLQDKPGILQIEVGQIPTFYREQNPQPRKHTIWSSTDDFTQDQASTHRRHCIMFPKGTLEKPYKKLVEADSRLYQLTLQPFPSSPNPYFNIWPHPSLPISPFINYHPNYIQNQSDIHHPIITNQHPFSNNNVVVERVNSLQSLMMNNKEEGNKHGSIWFH